MRSALPPSRCDRSGRGLGVVYRQRLVGVRHAVSAPNRTSTIGGSHQGSFPVRRAAREDLRAPPARREATHGALGSRRRVTGSSSKVLCRAGRSALALLLVLHQSSASLVRSSMKNHLLSERIVRFCARFPLPLRCFLEAVCSARCRPDEEVDPSPPWPGGGSGSATCAVHARRSERETAYVIDAAEDYARRGADVDSVAIGDAAHRRAGWLQQRLTARPITWEAWNTASSGNLHSSLSDIRRQGCLVLLFHQIVRTAASIPGSDRQRVDIGGGARCSLDCRISWTRVEWITSRWRSWCFGSQVLLKDRPSETAAGRRDGADCAPRTAAAREHGDVVNPPAAGVVSCLTGSECYSTDSVMPSRGGNPGTLGSRLLRRLTQLQA